MWESRRKGLSKDLGKEPMQSDRRWGLTIAGQGNPESGTGRPFILEE